MIKFKCAMGDSHVWIRPSAIIAVSERSFTDTDTKTCVIISTRDGPFEIGEHIDSVLNKIKNSERKDPPDEYNPLGSPA